MRLNITFCQPTFLLLCFVFTLNSFAQPSEYQKVALEKLPFYSKVDSKTGLYSVVFLGTDCPISQKYIHTLRTLHDENRDVAFYGVVPHHFTEEQLSKFKYEYGIPFPLYRDKHNTIAMYFKATITPEVFLFDETGKIHYKGAIDNWFYALGRNRAKPTKLYLNNAIDELRAGKKVSVAETKAIGCMIEMKH